MYGGKKLVGGAHYFMQTAYVYWRCRQDLMRSFEVGITDVEGDSKQARRMDCRHLYVEAKSSASPLPDLHHVLRHIAVGARQHSHRLAGDRHPNTGGQGQYGTPCAAQTN